MKIVTHSGNYHTDEVFAIAALKLKFKDVEIVRSRDKDIIDSADIVVDVGLKYEPTRLRFDHHQPEGAGKHENGIPYASFGLIWKEYGVELAGGGEEAKEVEKSLVLFVDAVDNGISTSTPVFNDFKEYYLHYFFHSFIESDDSTPEELDAIFMNVLEIAKGILEREIRRVRRYMPQVRKIKRIIEDNKGKDIVVIDENLPWNDFFSIESFKYVIYPRKEGNWGVKAVRIHPSNFEVKKPFPKLWAGRELEELREITGVKDAIFAHKSRYLVGAESKEGALELAQKALNA